MALASMMSRPLSGPQSCRGIVLLYFQEFFAIRFVV